MICTSEASAANSSSFRVTKRPSDIWRYSILQNLIALLEEMRNYIYFVFCQCSAEVQADGSTFPWTVYRQGRPDGSGHWDSWDQHTASQKSPWSHKYRPRWGDLHLPHLWRGTRFPSLTIAFIVEGSRVFLVCFRTRKQYGWQGMFWNLQKTSLMFLEI